jgi:6-pyruvoyl-tetrahydropterin synthase
LTGTPRHCVSVLTVPIPETSVMRTATFEAAHRLAWHPGKCRNLHGHAYRLDVTVGGPLEHHGVVVDFDLLTGIRTGGTSHSSVELTAGTGT